MSLDTLATMTEEEAEGLLQDAQVNIVDWTLRFLMMFGSLYAFALGYYPHKAEVMSLCVCEAISSVP